VVAAQEAKAEGLENKTEEEKEADDKVIEDAETAAEEASDAYDEEAAKFLELDDQITEMNPGLAAGATVDDIATNFENGKRVFLTSEVNAQSSYLGFELLNVKLGAQKAIWQAINATDNADANDDRVKADALSIKAIDDYETYITDKLLKGCAELEAGEAKTNCTTEWKIGAEKHNFKAVSAQYNVDYLKAEIAQAETIYVVDKTDGTTAEKEANEKVGAYLDFMKSQRDEANSYLMQASQGVVASENSMMSLWIFVSIMAVIALAGTYVACKQCRDEKRKEKEAHATKAAAYENE